MQIRIKRYLLNIDYWVLISCLLLLRLPIALGYRQQPAARLLFLLPLVLVSSKNLLLTLFKSRIRFSKSLLILFLFFSLILAFAFVRTILSDIFPTSTILGNFFIWVLIAIFGFTLFTAAPDEQTRIIYRRGIFIAISLYFIFNLTLYSLGFQSPEVLYVNSTKAVLLNSVGINLNRALFPTAGGINSFGTTAGIGLVACFVILTMPGSKRVDQIISVFGGLSSFAIIIYTDSRGTLAYTSLLIFLILILPKMIYGLLRWLPVIAPLLPLTLLSVLRLLPETVVSTLSRSGSDLTNMSNRLVIWNIVLDELINFKWIHLIGFGYRGQVLSGLSRSYSFLFTSYTSSEIASAHNSLLQSVLEVGYLGSFLFIALLFLLMGKLAQTTQRNRNDYTPKAMLFVLAYLILSGITEAVFSPDYQEIFTVFIFIWAATGTMYIELLRPQKPIMEPALPTNPVTERI